MLVGELRAGDRRSARRRAARATSMHDHEHEHAARPRRTTTSTTPTTTTGSSTATAASTHSHAPAPGSTITWRSLFVLGLAGGLIPSTSALLILLGSIAAGRPAFGFVLVVAFGLGMAAVMGGDRPGRWSSPASGSIACRPAPAWAASATAVPLVAAVLVFGFGIYLTVQAIGGPA